MQIGLERVASGWPVPRASGTHLERKLLRNRPMQRSFLLGIALLSGFSWGCRGGRAVSVVDTRVPIAPPGVYVEEEVAAGYSAYGERLARWGEWSPDAMYGVHWCPRGVTEAAGAAFHPYRERGHWDGATTPTAAVPPGSAYWVSDDSETWGDITMHHGWWVDVAEQVSAGHTWCWVPGLSETPARVVWRSGDGFIGWAPEPPSWVDDGGEGLFAFFSWSFTLMGALFEPSLRDQCLEGEAQEIAANVTSARAIVAGPSKRFSRLGPNAERVSEARKALVTYTAQHPEILTAAKSVSAQASAPASESKSASTTTTTKKKEAELPIAMSIVPVMMREPMIGPMGLTPRFIRLPDPVMASINRVDTSSAPSEGSSPSQSTPSSSWTAHSSTPVTSGSFGSGGFTGHSAPTHSAPAVGSSTSQTSRTSTSVSHTSSSGSSSSRSSTSVARPSSTSSRSRN